MAGNRGTPGNQGVANAKKPPSSKAEPPTANRLLVLSRSAAVGALIGEIRVLQAISFFWTVLLGYGFLVVLAVEAFFDPLFKRVRWWLLLFVIVAGAVFSIKVVFVPSVLEMSAFSSGADYPEGQTIAGIQWSSKLSKLRVHLINPNDDRCENVNIVLRPDQPVAAIGQSSNIPGVSFSDAVDTSMRQELVEASGREHVNPLTLIATSAGYRVRCPELPPNSRLELVMAIVTLAMSSKTGKQASEATP